MSVNAFYARSHTSSHRCSHVSCKALGALAEPEGGAIHESQTILLKSLLSMNRVGVRGTRPPHVACRQSCALLVRCAGNGSAWLRSRTRAGRGGPSQGLEAELLPRMLDHTIRTYFPDIWRAHLGDTLQVLGKDGDLQLWSLF